MTELPWVAAISAADGPAAERERIGAEIERDGKVEGVLLKTCHRVELYGFGDPPDRVGGMRIACGDRAVHHLLRVAAGLESAEVGEDEILHQVRGALRAAAAGGRLDGRLQRLFEVAVATGRRARAGRTGAGGGLPGRAIDWLRDRTVLRGRALLVVGAGRMGSALAHAGRKEGAVVTIASRDPERAARLASLYEGRGIDLAEGAVLANRSAAIAVALAGPWRAAQGLEGPLPPIVDLSAPSALPESLRCRLDAGFLGVDDLFSGTAVPAGYIESAERLVTGKAIEYLRWLKDRT